MRHMTFPFSNSCTVQKRSVFLGHSLRERKAGGTQRTGQQNAKAKILGKAIELLHGLFY